MTGFLETYFVKRRTLFATESGVFRAQPPVSCQGFRILGPGDLKYGVPVSVKRLLESRTTRSALSRRMADDDLYVFVAVTESARVPAGVVWALAPQNTTMWHDSVPVRPGEALGFGSYVVPEFRRRGLFTALMWERDKYLFEHAGASKIVRVVENSNVASYNGLVSYGAERVADNWLIKLFRHNILSILRRGTSWEIYALVGNRRTRL